MNMFLFSLCLDEPSDLSYPETEYQSLCMGQSIQQYKPLPVCVPIIPPLALSTFLPS